MSKVLGLTFPSNVKGRGLPLFLLGAWGGGEADGIMTVNRLWLFIGRTGNRNSGLPNGRQCTLSAALTQPVLGPKEAGES